MSNKAHAERLFNELGPLLEPLIITYDADEAHWVVVIDETNRIDIVYDEANERFVFALDLGDVPDEAAGTVHELLLRFSFVWDQTGGLHAALDDEGRAVLMYKHPARDLDVQTLQALLRGLHTHGQYWAGLIADAAGDDDLSEALEDVEPVGVIRP